MTVAEAVTLMAAVASFVTALGSVAVSWRNASKIEQVHTLVNSQATKFETLAQAAGFAKGVATERAQPGSPGTDPRPG